MAPEQPLAGDEREEEEDQAGDGGRERDAGLAECRVGAEAGCEGDGGPQRHVEPVAEELPLGPPGGLQKVS